MPDNANYTARLEEVSNKLEVLTNELWADQEFNDGRLAECAMAAWTRTRDAVRLAQRIDQRVAAGVGEDDMERDRR